MSLLQRVRSVFAGRHPSEDERTRKAQEIKDQQVKSDRTLRRIDQLTAGRLERELDGAVASFRR